MIYIWRIFVTSWISFFSSNGIVRYSIFYLSAIVREIVFFVHYMSTF